MNQDTEKKTAVPGPEPQKTPAKRKDSVKPHLHINLHIVLISLIVLTIAVIAFKLYKWNKGVPSDYDPNLQTDAFDVEVLDNIIPLAPDKLEGHEDDGVTTILCLGNDPFSLNREDTYGLANQIAAWRKDSARGISNGFFRPPITAMTRILFQPWKCCRISI